MYSMIDQKCHGWGIKMWTATVDFKKALEYFKAAAERGNAEAQFNLGAMHIAGLGVRKDCNAAQFFLKHAAEHGPIIKSLMSTALYAHDHGRPRAGGSAP